MKKILIFLGLVIMLGSCKFDKTKFLENMNKHEYVVIHDSTSNLCFMGYYQDNDILYNSSMCVPCDSFKNDELIQVRLKFHKNDVK